MLLFVLCIVPVCAHFSHSALLQTLCVCVSLVRACAVMACATRPQDTHQTHVIQVKMCWDVVVCVVYCASLCPFLTLCVVADSLCLCIVGMRVRRDRLCYQTAGHASNTRNTGENVLGCCCVCCVLCQFVPISHSLCCCRLSVSVYRWYARAP